MVMLSAARRRQQRARRGAISRHGDYELRGHRRCESSPSSSLGGRLVRHRPLASIWRNNRAPTADRTGVNTGEIGRGTGHVGLERTLKASTYFSEAF
jgi:hypothetical protein